VLSALVVTAGAQIGDPIRRPSDHACAQSPMRLWRRSARGRGRFESRPLRSIQPLSRRQRSHRLSHSCPRRVRFAPVAGMPSAWVLSSYVRIDGEMDAEP
jgi:hypothetical protein